VRYLHGTENDDTNPPRIVPRHLLISAGTDNLSGGDRTKNHFAIHCDQLTNNVAHNFLQLSAGPISCRQERFKQAGVRF
jgi:hypothetical protein